MWARAKQNTSKQNKQTKQEKNKNMFHRREKKLCQNLSRAGKKSRRQNKNIPSYHSPSVSDGGCCYSNRTVIKESISSCARAHTSPRQSANTRTHTQIQSDKRRDEGREEALFLSPIDGPSRRCACLPLFSAGTCARVHTLSGREQGIKSFLITHLSLEKHSAYFV